jgi:Flp pilus assembly protein TadD
MQGLHDDSDLDAPLRGSGAGSRWILAVVLLGGLALIAGTVGRDYFLGFIRQEPEAAQVDERVPALLEQARVALAKGDLENAHAEIAKASVLAGGDPRVTAALARLELSRAELSWLELRLANTLEEARTAAAAEKAPARRKKSDAELAAEAAVAQKQATEKKQLEQSFKERMARAKVAVAEAAKAGPTALEVVRAQVDALRLEGQVKQARALVHGLSAQASDPDNAYSLGALDLAEGESGYASAIDRLRVAARAEEALGKARPLLIYALAQSGDGAGASAELDKLATVAPNHRALPALRGLVELKKGATGAAPATVKAAASSPAPSSPAPSSPVASSPAPRSPEPSTPAPRPRQSVVDDVQASLTRASTLHRQGDLSGAEGIYDGIVKRFPNNVTALSGLGDIARQRGENNLAATYYDRILQLDSNHVPSVMARADLHWHAGNRVQAVALYRRALGQVGPSDAFGQRALRRIEEFDKSAAEETPAPEGESTDDGESSAPAAPSDEAAPDEPAPTPAAPAAPADDTDDTESPDEAPAEESAEPR